MIIFFKTITGKTLTLEVEASDFISDVQQRLEHQEDLPEVSFIFQQTLLDRNKRLSDYNIQKESTLFLRPFSRPGPGGIGYIVKTARWMKCSKRWRRNEDVGPIGFELESPLPNWNPQFSLFYDDIEQYFCEGRLAPHLPGPNGVHPYCTQYIERKKGSTHPYGKFSDFKVELYPETNPETIIHQSQGTFEANKIIDLTTNKEATVFQYMMDLRKCHDPSSQPNRRSEAKEEFKKKYGDQKIRVKDTTRLFKFPTLEPGTWYIFKFNPAPRGTGALLIRFKTHDLESLLKERGFEKFIEVFKNEEVDLKSFRLLNDEDLKGLGIKLGPRKLLLDLIGEMNCPPKGEKEKNGEEEEEEEEDL